MAMKRSFTDSDGKKSKVCKSAPQPDFINFLSVPSLESMSIVRLTTALCKQSVIADAIREHLMEYDPVGLVIRGTGHDNSLNVIESKILNHLDRLPLPESLKTKASYTVRPIYLQIVYWMREDRKNVDYGDLICWRNEGTIDKSETQKRIIDKDADVKTNFKSACKYCLEESIPRLWEELPEGTKERYSSSKRIFENYDNHLIAYWSHNVRGDLPDALFAKLVPYDERGVYDSKASAGKNMFASALFTRNISAAKYFWNKLEHGEISGNLAAWVRFTLDRKNTDGLFFLLSQTAEQREILRRYPRAILRSLITWPWHRFLMPTINSLWEHVDAKSYVHLSYYCILSPINLENTTGRYLPIDEFWSDAPVNLKKELINDIIRERRKDVFCKLLFVEKVKIAKEMLQFANLEDRKQILFQVVEDCDFFHVVHSGKLGLFDDLCVDALPHSDVKSIKERTAREHSCRLCSEWIAADEWGKVESFFNWAFDTRDRIERFKNETLNKTEVTYSVIRYGGNFEYADKFLSWCFGTEEEVREFKLDFAESKPNIVEIGRDDWRLFEKFVDWCFHSDEDVRNFKSYFSQPAVFGGTMFDCIVYDGYKFDFVGRLIRWCCISPGELGAFKEGVALSAPYMAILQRFVSNYKLYGSDWNNWELIRRLLALVRPLLDVAAMKRAIESRIDFDDFRGNFSMCFKIPDTCYRVEKKHLFRLLDNDSYDMSDSSEESCGEEDESELTEVLNNVESVGQVVHSS